MSCCRLFFLLCIHISIYAQEWSSNIGSISCPPNEIFYSPCRPCDKLCDEANQSDLNETCNELTSCTAGCACASGFLRTSQGACVNTFMCSSSFSTKNETDEDDELRITKKKCYEGYCKKGEFCIEAGIGAICLRSTLTTSTSTTAPTTTTTTKTTTTTTATATTKTLRESPEGLVDLSTESERKPISKCQNMKCAHGGMCFEVFGEARCFTSPLCRNALERWYDCMPCEDECSNRTVIQKKCSADCRAGCACRPTFIRDEDGSCTLPIVCLNDFKPLPIINLEPLVVVDTKMDRNKKIIASSSSSSSSEEQKEGEIPYE